MFAIVPRHPHLGAVIIEHQAKLLLGQTQHSRSYIPQHLNLAQISGSSCHPLKLFVARKLHIVTNHVAHSLGKHSSVSSVSPFKQLHVLLIMLYRSSIHDTTCT